MISESAQKQASRLHDEPTFQAEFVKYSQPWRLPATKLAEMTLGQQGREANTAHP